MTDRALRVGMDRQLKPCLRCGKCCKAEICMIGEMAFGSTGAFCPGLIKCGNTHVCGLVAVEKEAGIEPLLSKALGIGKGCDSIFANRRHRAAREGE